MWQYLRTSIQLTYRTKIKSTECASITNQIIHYYKTTINYSIAGYGTIVNSPQLKDISAKLASPGKPGDVARAFVAKQQRIIETVVTTEYRSIINMTIHVYFKQRIGGIEIINADIGVTVNDNGLVVAYNHVSYKPSNVKPLVWLQFTLPQMQTVQQAIINTVFQHLGVSVSTINIVIESLKNKDNVAL
jgi:hypothetical protein